MNKNAIQKYAIWARRNLIEQVRQRAYNYGIEETGYGDEDPTVIDGRVLSADEKRQRRELVAEIKKHGYQQTVEETAYTWFNRFVALRFMEVNNYIPTKIRVFSDINGDFKPQIIEKARNDDIELDGLDKTKVSKLFNDNQTEELYRYLLLTQCNALNAIMPEIFEELGSYTEMLLPNNILKQDSVLARLVNDIPEEDWHDSVQIIGWLYQYYNTEPKQTVFDGLNENVKIGKEEIPAATQLFTPDWIVRYMVENSLGRLWLESHPNCNLKDNWKYYVDEAEQTPDVAEKLRAMRNQSPIRSPEDIRLIDPCMGSGHILVYAFDLLIQIYVSEGYLERDAAKLILEKNIYGLDIDRRAYQLAYFALMMKARKHNRRIFTENVMPQVYHPGGFPDGEEYGSLVKMKKLEPKPEKKENATLFDETYKTTLNTWNFKRVLAQKYDVVVTNPPYMASSGMNGKLLEFVKKNYADSKNDLFAAFIERGLDLIKPIGYNCMVTMQSWMFLSGFETMRKRILSTRTIMNLLHMENMVMGIAFGTAVANIYNQHIANFKGQYNYITMKDIDEDKPTVFPTTHKRNRLASVDNFAKIPGSPVAYWVDSKIYDVFSGNKLINDIYYPRQGLATGNNDRFLRLWFEVIWNDIGTNHNTIDEFFNSGNKYVPYNKGGTFSRWYLNQEWVIRFDLPNYNILRTVGNHLPSKEFYFQECITWSKVTSGDFSTRYVPKGSVFDVAGCSIFSKGADIKYLLGFTNSKVMQHLINTLSQTLNYEVGSVKSIPIIMGTDVVSSIVDENVSISQADWDSFETSWNFKHHPLIPPRSSSVRLPFQQNVFFRDVFHEWKREVTERFNTLKTNEEELNRIFIDIYGLSDELTPEVNDKDVTVRRADPERDIRSFISYAVGCMFGRYSLDCEGLAYAGGDWNAKKYRTFIPNVDNIIPICDDEYFDNDIVGRFVEFVRVVYGVETLEENLKFIADTLGFKGMLPREVIRKYFLDGFYKDHLKFYQKRPIYWLFDSGKKNGFKALIYLHRYSRDLLAKLRTDYVHELQGRYRTQLSQIDMGLNNATGAERVRLLKRQSKLHEQSKEIGMYEEKIHHFADKNITIDLDDGVKNNYAIFADVLAKI